MKKIVSILCTMVLLMTMSFTAATDVKAAGADLKVDGSYLTMEDESTGQAMLITRGQYLQTGDCTISKSGRGRIYVFGSTTANHNVDVVKVLITVEVYSEAGKCWDYVDHWSAQVSNNYYVSSSKYLNVEKGYYYRVHATHYAGMDSTNSYDMGNSVTDGIYIS